MHRDFAYRGYWIAESASKSAPRSIARVVVQKEQAQAPHRQIGMVKRCGLHSGEWHLVGNARTPVLRQRRPPMNEVSGELEVRSCHGETELRLREVVVNLPLDLLDGLATQSGHCPYLHGGISAFNRSTTSSIDGSGTCGGVGLSQNSRQT
jgi:hypothetical protein